MWLIALLACKDDPTPVDSALPAVCVDDATPWAPGQVAFVEASEAWGLTELAPVGVRISAVDFDGDGWPDLAVRRGAGADDLDAGARDTWLLRNTGAGRFEDVTEASGVLLGRDGNPRAGRPGPVWAWGDVDNDGDLDLYTGLPDANGDYEQTSELRLNDGFGHFTLAEGGELRVGAGDLPYGVAFTDADADGLLDLWVTQYGKQDRLYRGDGTGHFEDLTSDAGLRTQSWTRIDVANAAGSHTYAWSALACDLNNDGLPELLSASYGRAPNHLWLNLGGGVFETQAVASGYAYDERVDWSDNESARCWCTLHPTDVGCEGVPEPEHIACRTDDDAFRWDHTYDRELFRLGGNSGGTSCGDVNNDGWMDLLTSEIVHWDVGSSSDPSELLLNTQDPLVRFSRPGNEVTGLTRTHDIVDWNDGDITNSLFDFDNDGWLDVYIGDSDYPETRGRLWHQVSPERFEAVDPTEGIDHTRSHGSALADFDRDGDLDLVVGHSSARCEEDCYDSFAVRLFENQLGAQSNWLQLMLEGRGASNRAAIGARVEVSTPELTRTLLVDGGHGQFGQQDDLVQHVGLGAACEAEVAITWPDGQSQRFTVGGGYRYRVVQGEEPVVER